MAKARIKTGDDVVVIAGDDKGERGKVLQVLRKKERVLIEGINKHKFHEKAKSEQEPGGIHEREVPIHLSNVMLASRYEASRAAQSNA